jgi:acetylornithine/succinyldiaminopimelate/putrescine aminotransferase
MAKHKFRDSRGDKDIVLTHMPRLPVDVTRAKGAYVWDDGGNRYLDFLMADGLVMIGHNNNNVMLAVKRQLDKLMDPVSGVYTHIEQAAAMSIISLVSPKPRHIIFTGSGNTANDFAVRIARRVIGRPGVVVFSGSSHGTTSALLDASGISGIRRQFGGASSVKTATYGDASSLDDVLDADTAAVIIEPMQYLAGVTAPALEFSRNVEQLCRQKNVLLIVDETHTAPGRCGTFLASESYLLEPDIITLGEGIANGLGVGACLLSERAARAGILPQVPASPVSPLSLAATEATISTIIDDGLMDHACRMNLVFEEMIHSMQRNVKGLSGKGLLIGIDIEDDAEEFIKRLLERRILVGRCLHPKKLRFYPPLNVTHPQIAELVDALNSIWPLKLTGAAGQTENRRYKRLKTNLITRVRKSAKKGEILTSKIRDISSGGVFIESSYPYPIGSVIEVDFRLSATGLEIHALGVVRWVKKKLSVFGMGVEFIEVSTEHKTHIFNFIKKKLDKK